MNEGAENSLAVSGIGLVFIVLMSVLTWRLPRSRAVIPLLLTAAFLPLGQGVVLFGLHLQFFRLLLLVGLVRVFVRRELHSIRLTALDKTFLCWALVVLVCGFMMTPTSAQFINVGGFVYNALASYFFVRCLVRDTHEVVGMIQWLAVIAVVLAFFMTIEKITGRNLFATLGGVPVETSVRDGHIRCQGAFRHAIVAGTFGATLFPLLAGLWFQGRKFRYQAVLGIMGCAVIDVTSASSGALLAMIVGGIGLFLWKLRRSMTWVRRGLIAMIIVLTLFMNAPVWYIFARIADVTGGSGWHRAYIIETAVAHLNEWWLIGTPRTVHWGGYPPPPGDPNNIDITNQYIVEGVKGGLLRLVLFVCLIVFGFKAIGRRTSVGCVVTIPTQWLYWCLGVCLVTHGVSFMSVSYFDQMVVFWYWLLAVISSLSCLPLAEAVDGVEARPAVATASQPMESPMLQFNEC